MDKDKNKNNEFDEYVDLGDITGNETTEDIMGRFFNNLSDVPDTERPRYKNEPRYKGSHGATIDDYDDDLGEAPGINSKEGFKTLDGYDDEDDRLDGGGKEKDGIFGKLVLGLASVTALKSLLSGGSVGTMLENAGIPLPGFIKDKIEKRKAKKEGAEEGGEGTGKNNIPKSKLGFFGLVVLVTMSAAIVIFTASFFSQYVRNFGVSDGGLSAAFSKVKDPEMDVDVFKTTIDKQILPYVKSEHNDKLIEVINPDGTRELLEFKTDNPSGYVTVETEKYNDGRIYQKRATREYKPEKKGDEK